MASLAEQLKAAFTPSITPELQELYNQNFSNTEVLGDLPSIGKAGFVVNPKNVGVLKGLIRDKLLEKMTGRKIPDMFDLAEAYFTTKYPKLSSLSTINFTGRHSSARARARLQEKVSEVYKNSFRPGAYGEVVGALAHENVHHMRYLDNPKAFVDYIPAKKDFIAYLNQPEEILANRAGRTAVNTLGNFLTELINSTGTSTLRTPQAVDPVTLALKMIFK